MHAHYYVWFYKLPYSFEYFFVFRIFRINILYSAMKHKRNLYLFKYFSTAYKYFTQYHAFLLHRIVAELNRKINLENKFFSARRSSVKGTGTKGVLLS